MGSHIRSVRLKVLLDEFYTDHRQKALVIIQKSWTTVNDLQEHIQKIFEIPKDVYLTVDGCLLPKEEAIHVVSEMDAVKVHPTKNSFTQLADAFAEARIYSTTECTPGTGTSGLSSPGFTRSAPKKQKKGNDNTPIQTTTQKVESVLQIVTTGHTDTIPVAPKRQRKRKRKNKAAQVHVEVIKETNVVVPPNVPKTKDLISKTNLHLRFNDNQNADTLIPLPTRIVKNPFSLPSAARVIKARRNHVQFKRFDAKELSQDNRSQSTDVLEHPRTFPQPCIDQAPMEPSRVINDLPVIDDVQSQALPTEAEGPAESALESMRHHIEELNLPAVAIDSLKQDDLIAFRMMKLTANYVPDLSAYIIGLVQSIEATNVIIFVMAGHEETREPTGKFSLDDDDDSTIGNDSIDQQLLYIQRSEILQAKYVKV